MKNVCVFVLALLNCAAMAGASTIGEGRSHSWSGNAGWMDWRPSHKDGAVIGQFVCSGFIHGANIGWIHLGSGIPGKHPFRPDAAYYSNASDDDYGVNVFPAADPLAANLRGLAYGANIGWIAFEELGNPQVNLIDGAITGYAWGANVGWINLGDLGIALVTESLDRGIDSDGDGIPDSWEFLHAGNLTAMDGTTDSSGNGMLDINAYRAGLDPFDPSARFEITHVGWSFGKVDLAWTTVPTRMYRIEARDSLTNESWTTVIDGIFPEGAVTGAILCESGANTRFYRVGAYRPLMRGR
jgi:hypothetical protein